MVCNPRLADQVSQTTYTHNIIIYVSKVWGYLNRTIIVIIPDFIFT